MKIILIIAGVVCFAIGSLLMNDYQEDYVTSIGIAFLFFGVFLGLIGLMMIPPL